MTLPTTLYDFGDTITINGMGYRVMSIHIYVSENGILTERYYLGKSRWLTIHREIGENND